jgi:hypothetical protein
VVLLGLQDQLAPLKSWLFPHRVYLQLEDQALTAMVLERESIAWQERVPLPEGACFNGAPVAVNALGDLLGDWLIERGYPGAHLKAVLPRAATAWRVIEWPDSQWPEQSELVVRQRQQELALPWDLHDADLLLEPLIGGPPRSLLVAAQRSVLEGWIDVFSQAGLMLDGLEPLPVCIWRAVQSRLEGGLEVLLQLEAQQTWLLALDQGQPLGEWPLPPVEEGPRLEAALQHWVHRHQPRTGVVSGRASHDPALLVQLQDWLHCRLHAFEPGDGEAALWGLVQGDLRR